MNWKLLLLAAVCVAQWAVPGFLVSRGEATLAEGIAYRFRTAPVDPVDPFRGRYVALDFTAAQVPVPRGGDYPQGQRLYAAIVVDDDGFARLLPPQSQPPAQGDWLVVTVQWRDVDNGLRLKLPFDRYYLDERLAPEAERVYREGNRRGEPERRPAWASVRVRRGYAVLEELYIDGVPVRERLRADRPGG